MKIPLLPKGYPENLIAKYNQLDLSTYPVSEVMQIINGIKVPAIASTIPVGTSMVKARPNWDGTSFSKVSELSYKPEEFNTTYQRSSTPKKTAFYAVVNPPNPSQREITHEQVIAAYETLPFLRDPSIDQGRQIITFGRWRLQESIEVVPFFFTEKAKNELSYTSDLSRVYREMLNSFTDQKEFHAASIIMFDFIADLFANMEIRSDFDYLFTAILSELIMYRFGFAGVAFPSVRTDRRGINLAIKPGIIDEKMMVLERVLEAEVAKRGENVVLRNLKYADVGPNESAFQMERICDPNLLISDEKFEEILEGKIH